MRPTTNGLTPAVTARCAAGITRCRGLARATVGSAGTANSCARRRYGFSGTLPRRWRNSSSGSVVSVCFANAQRPP
ncbi:hypothetical protein KCP75_23160 [Salmonella enterica subsp. enterica]|nr:hypothetical protein KCP75_23160 [Salmonella enterica subsp. enterica]